MKTTKIWIRQLTINRNSLIVHRGLGRRQPSLRHHQGARFWNQRKHTLMNKPTNKSATARKLPPTSRSHVRWWVLPGVVVVLVLPGRCQVPPVFAAHCGKSETGRNHGRVTFRSDSSQQNARAHARARRHGVDSRRRVLDGQRRARANRCAACRASRATRCPIHRVYVDGFWMDATEVTNEQFEKFVKATGYVTVAEQNADEGGVSHARRRRIWSPAPRSSRRRRSPCR